jgi:hypothetical protein
MSSRTIVVSTDEKTSRQLNTYEPIKEIITPVEDAHRVYMVKPGRDAIAQEILADMGFDPRTPQAVVIQKAEEPVFSAAVKSDPALEPVVDFELKERGPARNIRTGKYSADMKNLDASDLYHVIEYAILMGDRLKLDYAGGGSTRKGMYTVVPMSVRRGRDSCLEAEVASTKKKRTFDIKKIRRIGVETHGSGR